MNYSKSIGGALAGLGAITSVRLDIVDAATEEAPELRKCEHCGHAEAEQPGCIMICKGCAVESNDWRDAIAKHKCFKVCEDCSALQLPCLKYNKAPASRNIGVRAGGARGAAAPSNFGQLRFFGQHKKIWAKPVLKTSPCYYYYFEEINIFYFNLKSA